MKRILWSVIARWFLLLLSASIALTVLNQPVAAQQQATDYQWAELEDNQSMSDLTGYAQVYASPDGTQFDAYAETTIIYNGWWGQSWYGALVDATLYCNDEEIDSDAEYYDGSGGWAEVDFSEDTQPHGVWDFSVGYGYMDIVDYLYWDDEVTGSYMELTVADPTPVISSVNPTTWNADDEEHTFTIEGSHFGTTPLVQVNDSSIVLSCSPQSDSEISCWEEVPSQTRTLPQILP